MHKHNEVHTCCISIREVTCASAVSSRKKNDEPRSKMADDLTLMFMLHRFTRLLTWHKHKHKHKKMETIPFSYAYAYVTPGLHSLCLCSVMSQCNPGLRREIVDMHLKVTGRGQVEAERLQYFE